MCQHCYKRITVLASGIWVDEDGLAYCVKSVGPVELSGERAIRHTPMPVIR